MPPLRLFERVAQRASEPERGEYMAAGIMSDVWEIGYNHGVEIEEEKQRKSS